MDPTMPAVIRHEPLSQTQQQRLHQAEANIEAVSRSYLVFGRCLNEILEGRLYQAEYDSFPHYVESRWDIRKSWAYEVIAAYKLAVALSERGVEPGYEPRSVEQAGMLLSIKSASGEPKYDEIAEIWKGLIDEHGARVTGPDVREAVRRHTIAETASNESVSAPVLKPEPHQVADHQVRGTEPAPEPEERPRNAPDPVAHLRPTLNPGVLHVLDAQVGLFEAVQGAMYEFRRQAREALKQYRADGHPEAGLAREMKRWLTLEGPENWLACKPPEDGGCGGRGDLPGGMGPCPACGGIGFRMRLGGK